MPVHAAAAMNDPRDRFDPSQLRRLVDRLPSMLAYWDEHLRCRFANRAYEVWFGVDPEGLVGRHIGELLGPTLYELNRPHIEAALRGEEQRFERVVPGPGGVQRHSLAHYIPDVVDGRVPGFMVQVTEVTQLKEVEAALRREHTMREQAQAHAQQLDTALRERDETLDVLAHEVRQPLHNAAAVLQGAAAALAGSSAPALRRAQIVLGQVLSSVDNTLAVAGLVARQGRIRCVDTDIDMLLDIAIGDMPVHQRQRVRIERLTTTRTAAMDVSLMRLALRNLLANALQYSADGSAVVLRLVDSDDPLALLIEVADSGSGIDADSVPRMFDRGHRGRNAGISSGHGVGLFIVRRVMELHGGSVALVRNTPQGATMRLVIPP